MNDICTLTMFDPKSLSPTNLLYAKGLVTEDAESLGSETPGKHHCCTITANLEQKASSVCIHNNLTGDFSVIVFAPRTATSICEEHLLPPPSLHHQSSTDPSLTAFYIETDGQMFTSTK